MNEIDWINFLFWLYTFGLYWLAIGLVTAFVQFLLCTNDLFLSKKATVIWTVLLFAVIPVGLFSYILMQPPICVAVDPCPRNHDFPIWLYGLHICNLCIGLLWGKLLYKWSVRKRK